VESCANCNRPIGNLETPHLWQGNVVCPECHARLSSLPAVDSAASGGTTNQTINFNKIDVQATGDAGERVFYNSPDIVVTNRRLIAFGTTYPVNHITSVSAQTVPVDKSGPVGLLVVGVIAIIGAIGAFVYANEQTGNQSRPSAFGFANCVTIGALIIFIPSLFWVIALFKRSKQYQVQITTSAHPVVITTGKSRDFATAIARHINDAIGSSR